jgi:hypothetical protein
LVAVRQPGQYWSNASWHPESPTYQGGATEAMQQASAQITSESRARFILQCSALDRLRLRWIGGAGWRAGPQAIRRAPTTPPPGAQVPLASARASTRSMWPRPVGPAMRPALSAVSPYILAPARVPKGARYGSATADPISVTHASATAGLGPLGHSINAHRAAARGRVYPLQRSY